MGNFLNRLMDYTIKRYPICFNPPENFTSTGEIKEEAMVCADEHNYKDLITDFYNKLINLRRTYKVVNEKNQRWSVEQTLKKYPGWKNLTLSYLHSLFILFNNEKHGRINFRNFRTLLEVLGDKSSTEYRQTRFNLADEDVDGWIQYDEYLQLVYNFNEPSSSDRLSRLAQKCLEMSEKIRIVSNLSVGDQLEFGLF